MAGKANMSIVKAESASTSIQSLNKSDGVLCVGTSDTSLHQNATTSHSIISCSGDNEEANLAQCHLLIDEDEKMPLLASQCGESECSPDTTNSPAGDKVTQTYQLTSAQSEKHEDSSTVNNAKKAHKRSCLVITLTLSVAIAMSLFAYIVSLWLILYVWIEII